MATNEYFDVHPNKCGLSVDKRRCERCPRCRTWIDTSSSSSIRRPSGEFGDEGGGLRGRGGRSASSAYDGRDAANQRGYDDHDNDGYNYYSRPSDRGPRRSRGGGDGSDHYYDRDYDNYDDHGPRRKRRDHSNNNDDVDEDEEGNEFPKKKKREWPLCFESSGASFIFDARSGMFYEPSSDFFYDPKTKLYYSNVRQQYFRYDVDNEPHSFQPVGGDGGNVVTAAQSSVHGIMTPRVMTEVEEVSAESSPTGQVVSSQTKPEKAEPKQKIAISLKTPLPPKNSSIKSLNDVTALEKIKLSKKKLIRKESASTTTGDELLAASAGTLPQAHKKHAMDMSKWSERVKEMREDGSSTETQQQPSPPSDVKTTVSGQPMCVLCRRKFANVEKLRQHEKLSMLHKENLAKTASSASAVVAGPTTNASHVSKEGEESETSSYRDRSKERRLMYGSHVLSQSHAEALLAHSRGPSSTSTSASEVKHINQTIRPEETLNDTNVGNKLLQKLGWKSGETLGRNTTDGPGTKEDDAVNKNLRSDWERIESLAQGGGMRR